MFKEAVFGGVPIGADRDPAQLKIPELLEVLGSDLMGSRFGSDSLSVQRSSLCGHQAGFEQIEIGAAVHLAFDEFQSGDLTFDLTA